MIASHVGSQLIEFYLRLHYLKNSSYWLKLWTTRVFYYFNPASGILS